MFIELNKPQHLKAAELFKKHLFMLYFFMTLAFVLLADFINLFKSIYVLVISLIL